MISQTSLPAIDETLHLAAMGDSEALQRLLEFSFPLIRRQCHPDLQPWIDDIQQIVAFRLVRKFRSVANPYQASTMAAYRSFVLRTTQNVVRTIWRREYRSQSLEALNAASGFEPARRPEAEQINARLRLERCLELLADPLGREVFRRRFMLHESVDETVAFLRAQGHDMTQRDVYRLTERAILQLSRLPEVRDMFEHTADDEV